MTAAQKTAHRLSDAAASQQALPLAANEAFEPIDKALDPAQDGKYPSNVNGQDSQRPVDKFGQPLLVTESPSSIALASQTTTTVYAGRHLHSTAQADWHLAAGNVIAAAAAKGVSLFAQCKAQIEDNQKNGAVCENDGYVLMENALKYKRLINPPKGRGLDGLFEKQLPLNQPAPMPTTVTIPKPGKLVFIPTDKKPPLSDYDYVATKLKRPTSPTYPKFVVLEAKHISRSFDPGDTDGIKKAAKNRLGCTQDGTQMGTKWTERRIPQALGRKDSGLTVTQQKTKLDEIIIYRYARWIFACLPGPTGAGASSKLYVFIDVVATGMNLDSGAPPTRTPSPAGGNAL
ncbi:hypothetical protein LMG6871_04806 [Ralstonia edaphis]|nr:hypothetical protein LMG6871_04806 [Ralstonia sp. LMG 6871]